MHHTVNSSTYYYISTALMCAHLAKAATHVACSSFKRSLNNTAIVYHYRLLNKTQAYSDRYIMH
eukprot:11244-Heterococcus_DN1.PRE.2